MIVINNDEGQLCNKLLLLSNVYATAIDTNQTVYHIYWKYNEKLFRKTDHKNFRYPFVKLGRLFPYYNKYVLNKRNKKFSYRIRRDVQDEKRNRIHANNKHGIYMVDDWAYRDYEALFKHRERIVNTFTPVQKTEDTIEHFWQELSLKPDAVTIGVHIRRGDYKTWQNGKYYFTDEAYKNWMMDLAKAMPNKIVFILCSNEKINLPHFESDLYSVCEAPGSQMEDLYTLARCDYIMGPPSTYSWWAAFYGKKKYLTLRSVGQRIRLAVFREIEGEEFTEAYAEKMVRDGAL